MELSKVPDETMFHLVSLRFKFVLHEIASCLRQ